MASSKKKKPPLLSRLFYSEPCLFVTGWLLRLLVSCLYSTLRLKISGSHSLDKAAIVALWHDRLLLAPLIRKLAPTKQLAVVVSKSRDGRLLAAFAKTYPNTHCIYVGHKSRSTALLQMVEALDNGALMLITPDGPRGPRHVIKDGIFFCAEKADAQIVAMQWHASRTWKCNTWDQLQIPKPFSTITITFSLAKNRSPEALSTLLHNKELLSANP